MSFVFACLRDVYFFTMFRPSRTAALLFVVAVIAEVATAAEAIDGGAIASAWNRRTTAVRLEWKHDDSGVYRFQRYQSEWVPKDAAAAERRGGLDIDPHRLRFESVRFTFGEHGYNPGPIRAATVTEVFPERKESPYFNALYSHFADSKAAYRDVRPFLCVFDGSDTRGLWPAHTGAYPRGLTYKRLGIPRSRTIPLVPEEISSELQDLALCAAVVALQPAHPAVGVPLKDCEVAHDLVLADGDPCLVLTESPTEDSDCRRTFWLDRKRDLLVRRVLIDGPHGHSQIDIRYRHDEHIGWAPTEWFVSCRGTDAATGPRLYASHIVVTQLEPRGELTDREAMVDFPAGAWVIDDRTGKQHILRENGERREVLESEFNWLPTYAELAATEPGQVGTLVEAHIQRAQYWRWARFPMGVAGVVFTGALAVSIGKRIRRGSTASPSSLLASREGGKGVA